MASAALLALFARGGFGWVLGFVALVPWLCTLSKQRTFAATLGNAYLMTLAFTAATFTWFGNAVGNYTQMGATTGLVVLLLLAPLFQPQIVIFALVRHATSRRSGAVLAALTSACAWVAAERLIPKLLGDTLGHGLYPSALLRQAADLGGAAGLTFLLLLANAGIAAAISQRKQGWRSTLQPLAWAALAPLLLAGYGLTGIPAPASPTTNDKPLRMGMVQSNIVNYERLRHEKGAAAAVREILDTHYAMSYDAVERQHVDAVLWSETAYPTTFGKPKSQAGADLDREMLGIMESAGVPFVFGTYDRDDAGEYNAAAFVAPGTGLLGMYRKTRPFPLTEYVPPWLNSPLLKQWLPWTGSWLPGNGARVFPLRLADGREIPVAALICLDDVDTGLAIDAARLGARVLLTLSNDSWFTDHPHGAQLHQAVAAFRSIETRLPQFRVTTNGYSAVIDASGTVIASAPMATRTLVIGEVPVPLSGAAPPRTLMVIWGDWVGLVGAAFLVLLLVSALLPARHTLGVSAEPVVPLPTTGLPVAVLPPAARVAAGLLRGIARVGLLWMGLALLQDDALRANTLAQIRTFAAVFLAPEAAAWCVLLAFGARATIEDGMLVLTRGAMRLTLGLHDIVAVEPWYVPLPSAGAWLRLASGERWSYSIALTNPTALANALKATQHTLAPNANTATVSPAAPEALPGKPSRLSAHLQARASMPRGRLDQPLAKHILLPLALALVAFRLHQYIAYGGTLGEFYTFGLKAYLTTFTLWWAAWIIGVTLCSAALRAAIEAGTLLVVLLQPTHTSAARLALERLGLAALYIGLPMWLLLQIVHG